LFECIRRKNKDFDGAERCSREGDGNRAFALVPQFPIKETSNAFFLVKLAALLDRLWPTMQDATAFDRLFESSLTSCREIGGKRSGARKRLKAKGKRLFRLMARIQRGERRGKKSEERVG